MKHALRSLARSPGFTAIAIITLALGIGLNTAMFSIINTLILQPVNFPHPEELFRLDRTTSQQQQGGHLSVNALELQRETADFAPVAIFRVWGYTLSEDKRPPESLTAFRITANFFDILGVKPVLGRAFRPEEETAGQNNVILLSHRLWESRYGSDPSVIGRVVKVGGEPSEIIGVMPASLGSSANPFGFVQIYRPLGLKEEERTSLSDNGYNLLGRYRPGVTPAQAAARFDALAARLAHDHPKENANAGLHAVSLQATRMGTTGRQITAILLGLSGFVLLIACANLANLLLARAVAHAREYAIRAALGASRLQLIRPLALECVLLALVGGACGLLVSFWTTGWMSRQFSDGDSGPRLEFALDWRVIGFALLASLATALFFGVAPAWLVSRIRVNDTLKSGTRGSTGDRSQNRFRQLLIVGQFALALVLLAGAAFFVRGIDRIMHQQSGWNPVPLVSGKVSLPSTKTSDPDGMIKFYEQVQERLGALPGVKRVAVSLDIPLFGFTSPRAYVVDGREPPPVGREPTAFTNAITPDYFDVVGTRLLRGRNIAATDTRLSPPVVVINETMARTLFPAGDAIGHRISAAGTPTPVWAEIVGVAEDVRFLNLGPAPTGFQLYKPLTQETWGYVAFTVQAAQSSAASTLVEPFRLAIAALDPDLPMLGLAPVPTAIERNMSDLKVVNQLLVAFAVLGLFLAALGIYGVIARLVVQRTNEIGIRMALGAQMGAVVRLILGAGVRMILLGAVFGLLGAIGLARFLAHAMPAIATNSSAAIAITTVVLITVAHLACWLPARRAAKVNPLTALHAE
jgi:predicted permease